MTDFGTRVREAIEHGTEGGAPTDLVGRVHERARARRRRTTALVASVSAAAVAVVAIGIAQLTGPDPSRRTPSADGSPSVSESAATDPGWRWESWHDVQVQVPADWLRASRSQWCTMSGRTDGWRLPRVWRSDQPETRVRCSNPSEAYGLTFIELSPRRGGVTPLPVRQYGDEGELPEGSWTGGVVKSDVLISVAAPDRETLERILDSVDIFRTHPDHNGCFFAAERNLRIAPRGPRGGFLSVSVCRYTDGFWLQQSERLRGADAEATIAALDAAPVKQRYNCPIGKIPQPVIELVTPDGVAQVWIGKWCQGVFWKNRLRQVTPDVMYWALSPGFMGSLPDDVPMPSTLRS